jgi:hypothetical protein
VDRERIPLVPGHAQVRELLAWQIIGEILEGANVAVIHTVNLVVDLNQPSRVTAQPQPDRRQAPQPVALV